MEEHQSESTSQGSIRLRLVGFVLLAIVVGALSWFLLHTTPAQPKITNVLLISIDTCRADYLSCYGYPHATTPNIDAIAREGVLFSNVLTPVPLTLPAHSSMLTGTIPPYHGAHLNLDYQLGPSSETLAEILKGHHFATGAVISSFVLDSRFGMSQGFDTYHDRFDANADGGTTTQERKADEASRYAISWLYEHGHVPFFLFLHYYDPHDPYEPPEPFASRFPGNPYAGEIAYTDHSIGQVIGKLKELGLYDSTLIVITADHGEMLGEHGEMDHGYFIYEAAVKVPMIFKLPGQSQPRRIEELVGLIDIVPTVCRLLGIEPGHVWQGMDLSDCLWKGTNPERGRHLYCESLTPTNYDASSLLGMVTDLWKYIQTNQPELYDLVQDPDETKNLASTEVDRASDMQSRLKEILDKQLREVSDSKFELDEKARQQLESLGYVGGSRSSDAFSFDVGKEDPKELIDFHNSAQKLMRLANEKKYAEARSLCEQMLRQRPDYSYCYRLLGLIALDQGDYAGAISYLRRALELRPDTWIIHKKLGLALFYEGKLDESLRHLRLALEMNSEDAQAHHALGLTLHSKGMLDEAISEFHRSLEIEPNYPEAHSNMANTLLAQGKADEAISHYQQALQIQPDLTEARYMWGVALNSQGKIQEAIQRFREVLQAKPDDAQTHCVLGIALSSQGRFDESIDHLRRAIQIEPGLVEAHNHLGKVLAVTGRPGEAIGAFQEVVRLQPDSPTPMNDLAWILATCPEANVRNADQAVKLAERACELTEHKNVGFLDTLAAAYAEAGQFDKAVTTIQAAIKLAEESQATEAAETFKKRLELYQQDKPYRESMDAAD